MSGNSKIIKVSIKGSKPTTYDIEIGKDLFDKMASEVKQDNLAYRYAVVTDSNVEALYSAKMLEAFKSQELSALLITLPAGEQSKTRKNKEYIEDKMLESQMARDSAIIALGGGVVGDIAGYTASTYNRGIPYIQYPTSLVACVDSSIGGKTAIDTPYGKNLIGTFYQPRKVYIDLNTLTTLKQAEIREGMAEVIKYGIIYDTDFFRFIDENITAVFEYDLGVLEKIVQRSCEIKGYVVENDEKESNLRKILNFGHTAGHAVEQLSDYTITHGNAISIGMVMEAEIAQRAGILTKDDVKTIYEILDKAGLPTVLGDKVDRSRIIDTMKLDKKARRGNIEFALPKCIGTMHTEDSNYGIRIEQEIIERVIKEIK